MDPRYPGFGPRMVRKMRMASGESPSPYECYVLAAFCCFGWDMIDRNKAAFLPLWFPEPITPEFVVLLLEKYLPIAQMNTERTLLKGYCKELAFLKFWDEWGLKRFRGLELNDLLERCDSEALIYTRANPTIDFLDWDTPSGNPKFAGIAKRLTVRDEMFASKSSTGEEKESTDTKKRAPGTPYVPEILSLETMARIDIFALVHVERWPMDVPSVMTTMEETGPMPSVLLPRSRSKSCSPTVSIEKELILHGMREELMAPTIQRNEEFRARRRQRLVDLEDFQNWNVMEEAYAGRPATKQLYERAREFGVKYHPDDEVSGAMSIATSSSIDEGPIQW